MGWSNPRPHPRTKPGGLAMGEINHPSSRLMNLEVSMVVICDLCGCKVPVHNGYFLQHMAGMRSRDYCLRSGKEVVTCAQAS